MLDLKKANEVVRKAKRETEIYRTKLVPYAKKIIKKAQQDFSNN